jgi:class 3 adenylate cyclase
VRSFTTISEALSPNETFGFINGLLSRTGPVVREHGGIVDKYVGDAIMALFPGAADDGLRAAIALQGAVAALNIERAAKGLVPIAVGVGLHRGSLMLGTNTNGWTAR